MDSSVVNSHQTQNADTRPAPAAFYFNSSAHLLRIGREQATNLGELLEALRVCPDESIFQHTFRTLQEHHFIREGFSNDFAHWAYSQCNEPGLAERLASLDVRRFTSLSSLRDRIVEIVEDYLKDNPASRDRKAVEPFYFCASEAVVIPTSLVAHDLSQFIEGLKQASIHSIYHHFIEARLRLKLISNDFSLWIDRELGFKNAAMRLNGIDIYTSTLDGVRNQIIRILQNANN